MGTRAPAGHHRRQIWTESTEMSVASCLIRCGVVLASALACGVAPAERADRNRPTLIEADKQAGDDLHQTAVYTGNVVLTRGTLRMTGDRLEAREDPEGYRIAD